MDTFTCFICGGVYKKLEWWSDDDAKEELFHNFGDISTEECEVICDDCYKKMRFEDHP